MSIFNIIFGFLGLVLYGGIGYGIYRFATRNKRSAKEEEQKRKEREEDVLKRKDFWSRTFYDAKILRQWSLTIEGGAGRSGSFLDRLAGRIGQSASFGMQANLVEKFLGTKWNAGRHGIDEEKRPSKTFLAVNMADFDKAYYIYVSADDEGDSLNIAWYLALEMPFTAQVDAGRIKQAYDLFTTTDEKRKIETFCERTGKLIRDEAAEIEDAFDEASAASGFVSIT